MSAKVPFDFIDVAFGVLAASTAPMTPLLCIVAVVQYFARHTVGMSRAIFAMLGGDPVVAQSSAVLALLPGVELMTREPPKQLPAPTPIAAGSIAADVDEGDPFELPAVPVAPDIHQVVAQFPTVVAMRDMKPYPPSPTAIPLGIAQEPQWIDLQYNTLHVGLYGTSGCGKDSLLRAWFLFLCKRNPPAELQFAFLDGKGDWLIAPLASLAHMFLVPAGGYGKAGDDRMRQAIGAIDREAERRQRLITQAGCRTREQYVAKTGDTMPLLVVCATDVMTSIAGDVENLLETLVSKARSLGIRVIVSMQTPTGRSTRWRMNLSTVIAGALQAGSQDEPALGIPIKEMVYRPSQLPNPKERPGVFVVRQGSAQHLVQAPYLDEAAFDRLCATLPQRDLLSSLLESSSGNEQFQQMGTNGNESSNGVPASGREVPSSLPVPVPLAEVAKIAMLLATFPPSDVVKMLDGYHPRKYTDYKAKVDHVAGMIGKGGV